MMHNGINSLASRLHAAALRSIAANGIGVVGRDGRRRVSLESIIADGNLADILREIGGEIPRHTDGCAANGRLPAECDCPVSDYVRSIWNEQGVNGESETRVDTSRGPE